MVMHHHKSCEKNGYLQGQDHSESSYCQNITVFAIRFELLIKKQKNNKQKKNNLAAESLP